MQQFCVSWARNYDISNNHSFTKLYNIIYTHKFEQANRISNKGRQQKYLSVLKTIFVSPLKCNEDDRSEARDAGRALWPELSKSDQAGGHWLDLVYQMEE